MDCRSAVTRYFRFFRSSWSFERAASWADRVVSWVWSWVVVGSFCAGGVVALFGALRRALIPVILVTMSSGMASYWKPGGGRWGK